MRITWGKRMWLYSYWPTGKVVPDGGLELKEAHSG